MATDNARRWSHVLGSLTAQSNKPERFRKMDEGTLSCRFNQLDTHMAKDPGGTFSHPTCTACYLVIYLQSSTLHQSATAAPTTTAVRLSYQTRRRWIYPPYSIPD